jgi:hypothetical protein
MPCEQQRADQQQRQSHLSCLSSTETLQFRHALIPVQAMSYDNDRLLVYVFDVVRQSCFNLARGFAYRVRWDWRRRPCSRHRAPFLVRRLTGPR